MSQSVPIDAALGVARTGQAIGCIVYALDGTTVLTAFSTTGWYEAPASSGSFHHAGISSADAGFVVAVGVSGTEYTRVSIEAAKLLASGYTAPDNTTIAAINTKTTNLPALPASTTNITGGTITTVGTVTNLTNAPTSGDLTTAMKASVNAEADTALADVGVTTTVTGRIDAAITSRMATFVYTAPTTPPTVAQIDTQLSGTHGSGGWATATGFATPSDVTTAQAAVTAAIAALNNLSSVQAQAAVAAALTAYSAATSTNVTATQTAILAKLPAALSGGKMDSAISQLDTTAFSVALLNLIADHVSARGAALTEASGVAITKYSPYHLAMQILNGTMAGSTGTAYATDGSTAFTVPLTTDTEALPVTGTH